ncbi:MAG: helix-hairpin-helix domain-containing protein [Candidatus Limnocylindria bacterium]
MLGSRVDQVLIGAVSVLVLVLAGIGWLIVSRGAVTDALESQPVGVGFLASEVATPPSLAVSSGVVVVDVEGAVRTPGVYALTAGSRVGDAIAAAGGYDETVDLDAAATQLNLALVVEDAQKILVPRIETAASEPSGGGDEPDAASGASVDGGLVNVNTATAEELEALPGIGPVTADKIVAARREQPFASLQELVDRGVINRGQLEDIIDLATAG